MQVSNNRHLNNEPKLNNNFKAQQPESKTFAVFDKYIPVPLNTSKAYCSGLIKNTVKPVSSIDIPYLGKGKIYVLPNGHRLAVVNAKRPFIMNTSVKAGQNDSPVLAHLSEHLLYKDNRKTDSSSFVDIRQKLGIDYGAETGDKVTNYHLQYPFDDPKEIETILKSQANLLQNSENFKQHFENEKNIIVAEHISQKYSNIDKLPAVLVNTLFGTNISMPENIAKIEDTKNIKLDDLQNFYDKHYQNKNMATFIVGDVEPDNIAQMFSRYFNKPNVDTKTVENTPQSLETKPIERTKRIDVDTNRSDTDNILVGFAGTENNDTKSEFLKIALRKYLQDIKNEQNFNFELRDTSDEGLKNSMLVFSAKADEKDTQDKLNDVYKIINELTQKPLTDEELQKLKISLKTFFMSIYSSSAVVAMQGATNLTQSFDLDVFKYSTMIDALKADDIQNFLKKYCDFNKAAVVVGHNQNIKPKEITKPSFKGNRNHFDTSGIVEYKYPNNHQLIVDSSAVSPISSYSLSLVANRVPDWKPGVVKAFDWAFVRHLKNYENEYPFLSNVNFMISPEKFELQGESTNEYSKNMIDFVKSSIFGLELTQKDLDEAKNIMKNKISAEPSKYSIDMEKALNSNDNLFNLIPLDKTKEEAEKMIDGITLDDLKSYQQFMINNSQAKSILVTSKDNFEKNQADFFAKINGNMPVFKEKQKTEWTDRKIHMIEKTKVMTDIYEDDNACIQQEFKIPVNIDTKEKIITKLLTPIIENDKEYGLFKHIREDKSLSYATGVKSDNNNYYYRFALISHLPLTKENSDDAKIVFDTYKNMIGKLTTRNITQEALENAKTKFKSDIILDWKYSGFHKRVIDDFDIENVRNLYQLLDGITVQDIKDYSKKYLTKPSIYTVLARKEVLEQNKTLLENLEKN